MTEQAGYREKLNKKFEPKDIDWVIVNAFDYNSKNGYVVKAMAIPYIQKEVAENLADEVFGAENWENDFEILTSTGYIKYYIRFKDGVSEWTYKRSASSVNLNEKGQFADDAFEIAITYAEKRAWSMVGIGRYLKLLPQQEVEVSLGWKEGWNKYSFKSKVDKNEYVSFYWNPPQLPPEYLPAGFQYKSSGNKTIQDPQPTKENPLKPATDNDWEIIMNYYNALPQSEQVKWDPYLFNAETDEDGQITGLYKKVISHKFAVKLINNFRKGYGELGSNNIPADLDTNTETELEKEIRKKEANQKTKNKTNKQGVTQAEIEKAFDAQPESPKK